MGTRSPSEKDCRYSLISLRRHAIEDMSHTGFTCIDDVYFLMWSACLILMTMGLPICVVFRCSKPLIRIFRYCICSQQEGVFFQVLYRFQAITDSRDQAFIRTLGVFAFVMIHILTLSRLTELSTTVLLLVGARCLSHQE